MYIYKMRCKYFTSAGNVAENTSSAIELIDPLEMKPFSMFS